MESTGWRPDTSDGINPDTSGNIHGSASERDELIVKNERALAIVGASYDGETEFGKGVLSLKKKDLIWDSGREEQGWAWVELIGANSGQIEKRGWFPPTYFQRMPPIRQGKETTSWIAPIAATDSERKKKIGYVSDAACTKLLGHFQLPRTDVA